MCIIHPRAAISFERPGHHESVWAMDFIGDALRVRDKLALATHFSPKLAWYWK